MIRTVESFLEAIEKALLVALFAVMAGLAFVQVVLRAGFSTGILWADVFLRHLVLWVGFLGAVLAVSQNKHFAMDVLLKTLPHTIRSFIEVLIDLFAVAVLWFLCISAIRFFKDDAQSGAILFSAAGFEIKSAWMNAVLPGAFILLAVHFALKTLRDVGSLLGISNSADNAPSGNLSL